MSRSSLRGVITTGTSPTRESSTFVTSSTCPQRSSHPPSRGKPPGRLGQGPLEVPQGNSATSPPRVIVPLTDVLPAPHLPTRLEKLDLDLHPWSSGEDSAGESQQSKLKSTLLN